MKVGKKLRTVTGFVSAAALLMSLFGCASKTPIEPTLSSTFKRTTEEMTFLESNASRLNKVFNVARTINAAEGGFVLAGNSTSGISGVFFPESALSQDLNVTFAWDSQNFTAEFGPHGSQFNSPVTIRLSYKDASLTDIDEYKLRIWYYNEDTQLWELTGQIVNTQQKYVEGTTTHFSRYAIGTE